MTDRQEPEIAPGLDRFEKNLNEAAGSSGRKAQKSGAISSHDQSSDKDDLNGKSHQPYCCNNLLLRTLKILLSVVVIMSPSNEGMNEIVGHGGSVESWVPCVRRVAVRVPL